MGPGMFVIAILGCADGSADCHAVATLPVPLRKPGRLRSGNGPGPARQHGL